MLAGLPHRVTDSHGVLRKESLLPVYRMLIYTQTKCQRSSHLDSEEQTASTGSGNTRISGVRNRVLIDRAVFNLGDEVTDIDELVGPISGRPAQVQISGSHAAKASRYGHHRATDSRLF